MDIWKEFGSLTFYANEQIEIVNMYHHCVICMKHVVKKKLLEFGWADV